MIGAGVTLSQIIKQFKSTSSDAGFSYLTEAARYLENVANLQIRNVSRYQNHVKKSLKFLKGQYLYLQLLSGLMISLFNHSSWSCIFVND